ncbi:MAG TPA: hypothetical protein VMM77_03130 [Gemmatimonadaceae bacterium]|nr:hypothetical protein [Gemmatimonadaceae bacterium]
MLKPRGSGTWGARCLTVLTLIASASAAGAQSVAGPARHQLESSVARKSTRLVRLLPGLLFGGSMPAGELGDLYSTGIRGGLTLTAVVPTQPFGIRAAVTHDRFGGGTVTPSGQSPVTIQGASMTSLTFAGLISERAERSSLLYLSAGVGIHRLDAQSAESLDPGDDEDPVDDPDEPLPEPAPETRFGASIAGGITFRFAGLPSYVEVQVVKLFGVDALVVPLVLGVQLGR